MLRKKLFRDLWHYKGQFFTIFLMVFIGMLAFSGIHGYMDGMDESAKAYYKEYNLQDLWITNTNVSDSDLEKLESMDKRCKSSFGFKFKIKGIQRCNFRNECFRREYHF